MAIPLLNIPFFWLLLLLLLLLGSSSSSALSLPYRPRLGVVQKYHTSTTPSSNVSSNASDLQTFYYQQTIDHFSYQPESYAQFNQRYVVNFKHWGGANASAPIFVYLGEESSLDTDIGGVGFLDENAPQFGAMIVYIEHRFYGKSIPYGSLEVAMGDKKTRGHFNSAQALADYAEIILHIKKNYSAVTSPVIVIGGSYGGMLASWFRLKYPHIAMGALASSAPILYFDDITPSDAYYTVVTNDFKEANESCYDTIRQSWSEIDAVAAEPNGLQTLSQKFKTCQPLKSAGNLKGYLFTIYAYAAQYDRPPEYPVSVICKGIEGGSEGTDILARIYAGVVAYHGKDKSCSYLDSSFYSESEDKIINGWGWQTCSELLLPIGIGKNASMFQPVPYSLGRASEYCNDTYGVMPRPHWITTYYGGRDIKEVLRRFGSNIIFSNGLRDPYSSAGVLEDISDTILAIHTDEGSHCLDIVTSTKDDPDWLIAQRKTEVETIKKWISDYNQDMVGSSAWSLESQKLNMIKPMLLPLLAFCILKIQ